MATTYLRMRGRPGSLNPATIGLSVNDLATDCIASLFERGTKGEFRLLVHYFTQARWTALSDEELISCTRRLVFSRTHQELCRIWKQGDPSLQKVIRNLKNALRASRRLTTRRIGNELWVILKEDCQDTPNPSVMSPDFFQAQLAPHVRTGMTMRGVANAVASVLEEQDIYRKAVPLTDIALSIRSVFVRGGEDHPHVSGESAFLPVELKSLLESAVTKVRRRMTNRYVTRGKVDSETFGRYLRSVYDILYEEFVLANGEDKSYYDFLRVHAPGVKEGEYRRKHRCHLEYLVKLAKHEFLTTLKGEI